MSLLLFFLSFPTGICYSIASRPAYSTSVNVYISPFLAMFFPVFIVDGGRNPYSPGSSGPGTVTM